jgi:hypothetical protein
VLIKAIEAGILPEVDSNPPFRNLLKHKAYLTEWTRSNIHSSAPDMQLLDEPVHMGARVKK